MVFDQIEKLKHDYTDKYVVVDETSPELARFRGQTGVVKTVNMSGRALVEFDANNNIGWYDIDLGFLKVIDQPLTDAEKAAYKRQAPQEAPAPKASAPAKPAAAAKESTRAAEKPAAEATQPAAKAGGKMSTADILAAACAKTAAAAPAAAPAAEAPAEEAAEAATEEAPAPAPKKAAAAGGDKPKAGQLKTPEIMAWCRAHDAK